MSAEVRAARNEILKLEYAELNANFRLLTDVRFKLLAVVPLLSGVAAFVLANIGLSAGKDGALAPGTQFGTTTTPTQDWLLALLGSLFGFLVSLGIVVYDQRNSELYNALVHRAKHLETKFNVGPAPGGLVEAAPEQRGGQFRERPPKMRRFAWVMMGHDLALAFIYGPMLGAWFFPAVYGAARLLGASEAASKLSAAIVAVLAVVSAISWLVSLDSQSAGSYRAAAIRDGLADAANEQE